MLFTHYGQEQEQERQEQEQERQEQQEQPKVDNSKLIALIKSLPTAKALTLACDRNLISFEECFDDNNLLREKTTKVQKLLWQGKPTEAKQLRIHYNEQIKIQRNKKIQKIIDQLEETNN